MQTLIHCTDVGLDARQWPHLLSLATTWLARDPDRTPNPDPDEVARLLPVTVTVRRRREWPPAADQSFHAVLFGASATPLRCSPSQASAQGTSQPELLQALPSIHNSQFTIHLIPGFTPAAASRLRWWRATMPRVTKNEISEIGP